MSSERGIHHIKQFSSCILQERDNFSSCILQELDTSPHKDEHSPYQCIFDIYNGLNLILDNHPISEKSNHYHPEQFSFTNLNTRNQEIASSYNCFKTSMFPFVADVLELPLYPRYGLR